MATNAFGTKLKWNGNYVAKLTSINGIQLSRDMHDVTTHQSSDQVEETLPGLIRTGDIPIEGFMDSSDTNGQLAMLTDFHSGALRATVIEYPASLGAQWECNCYLTGIKFGDSPVDGALPFSATLKPSGKPTLTISTSTGMSALSISNSAVIMPTFAIGTYEYVATVLTGVSSVTVTPTASGHTITVEANDIEQTVVSGQASSAITLGAAGSVTKITITVQESGKAPKVYIVNLARA